MRCHGYCVGGIALKCERNGDGVRYYLFYVFTVRYSGVKFADGNGVLNQMGINRIFAVDPDASAGHVEYFRKDHERIIAAANAFDVYNALSKDGNKAEVNPCLRNLFEQMDFAVCCGDDESPGCGKMVEHFDLTTAEFGPVEMRIVQKLML